MACDESGNEIASAGLFRRKLFGELSYITHIYFITKSPRQAHLYFEHVSAGQIAGIKRRCYLRLNVIKYTLDVGKQDFMS